MCKCYSLVNHIRTAHLVAIQLMSLSAARVSPGDQQSSNSQHTLSASSVEHQNFLQSDAITSSDLSLLDKAVEGPAPRLTSPAMLDSKGDKRVQGNDPVQEMLGLAGPGGARVWSKGEKLVLMLNSF